MGAYSSLPLPAGSWPSLLSSVLLPDLVEERALFTIPTCSKQGQDGEDITVKGTAKALGVAGIYTPYHPSLILQILATHFP